ncbi:MAG: CNNM domain-containing protein, partial [Candidatus Avelusimicrobium sp.]
MTILIILLMLVFNALLAAYEMALASISRTKLSILAQEKRSGAEQALYMKDHMEGSLAVVQIGITLVGAVAAASGGAGADEMFSPVLQEYLSVSKRVADILAVALVVVPLSFITIVFAELTPKTFAIKNKEFVVLQF